ncbi:MAG: AraC family transcriptional regulator [Armatimonadia bacterium]
MLSGMLSPNRHFDREALEVLLAPERWALVTPELAELEPCEDARHQRWMEVNTHCHAHREICLITRGEGVHGCGGAMYHFTPGTVFYFEAFVGHDQVPPPYMDGVDQLWFSVVKDSVVARLIEVRNGEFGFGGRFRELLTDRELGVTDCGSLLSRIQLTGMPGELCLLQLRAAVMTLVSALLAVGYAPPVPELADDFQGRVITMVARHIAETAGRGESLDSLARLAGYSKYHFLRLFQQHTGRSVHEYIDECRLQRVSAGLAKGHTQRQIAEELGFSSAAVFCRWYKRYRDLEIG